MQHAVALDGGALGRVERGPHQGLGEIRCGRDADQRNLVLDSPLALACPVRLLQGMADPDVPWQHATRLAEHLDAPDLRLTLIRDGEHRLSRPADLSLLCDTLAGLLAQNAGQALAP